MLDEGTTIQLGAIDLMVRSIVFGQPGYAPTNYATQTTPPPYQPTVQATQYTQPPQTQNSVQPIIPVSPSTWQSPPPTPPPSTDSNTPANYPLPRSNNLPVILGTSAAVLLAVVGGIAIAFNQKSIPRLNLQPSPLVIDASNLQCQKIVPTSGDTAKLRDGPDRNANSLNPISRGTMVLKLAEEAAFLKVQLPDGSQGWIYNDQVRSCSEASTTENPPQSQPSTSQPQQPADKSSTSTPVQAAKSYFCMCVAPGSIRYDPRMYPSEKSSKDLSGGLCSGTLPNYGARGERGEDWSYTSEWTCKPQD
jgi:hypothetical protein